MESKNVFDRIVEKNAKFWALTTDSTLTEAEKLRLVEELFPSRSDEGRESNHG